MRPQVKLVLFSAVVALVLPNLYGISCDPSVPFPPSITAPASGSTIPVSGLFTASVDFPAALTASSLVEMELQTNQGATGIDVTSLFLPVGQTDFAGATSASADLDAIALGLSPGAQTFIVRVDVDGVGGAAIGLVGFAWLGSSECESMASAALSQCFVEASEETRLCYASTGSACSPAAAELVAAANALRASVTGACSDGGVQSLGYGSALTASGLAERLVEECVGNAATLAARVYGGPHAKVLSTVSGGQVPVGETCLDTAFSESASFIDVAYNLQRDCLLDDVNCDGATVAADIANAAVQASSVIEAVCPFNGSLLEFFVGLLPAQAIDRARAQSECMAGSALADTSPLTLLCAPGS